MKHIRVIFKREFMAYFNSPIAYIFVIAFLLINCGLFALSFSQMAEMRFFFEVLPWTLAVFMPALTMRMWAEERRTGTIGLLLSLPAKNHELVLGKFFASLVFFLVMLACTLTIPIVLSLAGDPDNGPVLGGYIISILVGAFFLSVGLFASVLFKDQILALILGIVICLGLHLLGMQVVATILDGWAGGLGTAIRDVAGMAGRLEAAERGVLAIGDVVYFLTFTAAFLLLNVYALESRIRMRGASIFPAGVALVLTIAVVISMFASDLGLPRLDLTEEGRYSLSSSSCNILSRLKAQVKVRYYVTPKERMPTHMKNLERDVTDLLKEFASSSSNFDFEVIDPTVDAETQNKLQERYIEPFTVQTLEHDTREMKLVYSSISVAYLDKPEEIIPHVVPQALGQLEYAIISKVFRMTLTASPTIAIHAPLQYADARLRNETFRELMAKMGRPVPPPIDRFTSLKGMLREEGYEVCEIDLDTGQIPDEAAALLVLEPEKLGAEQLKKIENFVAKGRSLFVGVQKHICSYGPAPGGGMSAVPKKTDPGVAPLLRKFGVTASDDILMDKSAGPVRVPRVPRQMGRLRFYRDEWVKFPMQITVTKENMNKETGITDRLSGLFCFFPSALEIDEKAATLAGLEVRTLFTSSQESWIIPSKETPIMPDDTNPEKHKMAGPKPLAVYITGPAPGAKDVSHTTKVIIVGCAEMFSDSFFGAISNATFLLNAVDALALGEELVSVRSKGEVMRLLGKMSKGEKLFYRFLTLALVPIIFAAAGIVRSMLRKRRRAAYLKKFS